MALVLLKEHFYPAMPLLRTQATTLHQLKSHFITQCFFRKSCLSSNFFSSMCFRQCSSFFPLPVSCFLSPKLLLFILSLVPENFIAPVSWLLLLYETLCPKQLAEERVYLAYDCPLQFIIKESQGSNLSRAGTWSQELMQSPWRRVTCWIAFHGLFRLIPYTTQDHHPRNGTTHSGMGPSPSITN